MISRTLTTTLDSLEVPNEGYGNNPSQIGKLQEILKYYGYYQGKIDKNLGYKTERAICQVQQDLGLMVTGRFDEATWYGIMFWLPLEKAEPVVDIKDRQDHSLMGSGLHSLVTFLFSKASWFHKV